MHAVSRRSIRSSVSASRPGRSVGLLDRERRRHDHDVDVRPMATTGLWPHTHRCTSRSDRRAGAIVQDLGRPTRPGQHRSNCLGQRSRAGRTRRGHCCRNTLLELAEPALHAHPIASHRARICAVSRAPPPADRYPGRGGFCHWQRPARQSLLTPPRPPARPRLGPGPTLRRNSFHPISMTPPGPHPCSRARVVAPSQPNLHDRTRRPAAPASRAGASSPCSCGLVHGARRPRDAVPDDARLIVPFSALRSPPRASPADPPSHRRRQRLAARPRCPSRVAALLARLASAIQADSGSCIRQCCFLTSAGRRHRLPDLAMAEHVTGMISHLPVSSSPARAGTAMRAALEHAMALRADHRPAGRVLAARQAGQSRQVPATIASRPGSNSWPQRRQVVR